LSLKSEISNKRVTWGPTYSIFPYLDTCVLRKRGRRRKREGHRSYSQLRQANTPYAVDIH